MKTSIQAPVTVYFHRDLLGPKPSSRAQYWFKRFAYDAVQKALKCDISNVVMTKEPREPRTPEGEKIAAIVAKAAKSREWKRRLKQEEENY